MSGQPHGPMMEAECVRMICAVGVTAAAEHFGVHHQTAVRWANRWGVPVTPPAPSAYTVAVAVRALIAQFAPPPKETAMPAPDPRPASRAERPGARRGAIRRALDNAAAQGAVTHWQERGHTDRPWIVVHRGHCPLGGAAYTTAEVEAFCDGLAARTLARPATPEEDAA